MRFLDIFSRREKVDFGRHTHTDEHGCRWVDEKIFGFGDLSPIKDNIGLIFPSAKEYLRLHGNEYPWRKLWLERGEARAAPSRDLCLNINKVRGHIRGNCYNNALQLALGINGRIILPNKPKEVLYGEGIAVNPTGAHLHAWLVVDGNVYDPTWPDAYRATYFGVTFNPRWMLSFAETIGRVSLLQNWPHAQPRLVVLFENLG